VDLLEYQAKNLFQTVGIPVLPAQRIDAPADLKRLQIPYPVVLKSQVRAGGRGKAGGIRFVENTIDAIAAAQSIFNLAICGEYPRALLAETQYRPVREVFLSVTIDCKLQRPVLLGSGAGGTDLDAVLHQLHRVVVEEEFSPYYARRLAIAMGLAGPYIRTVSDAIERMYRLLVGKDLSSIEINPLGLAADGSVMALDGKIQVEPSALGRHPDLAHLVETAASVPDRPATSHVALIANSTGLALAARDGLHARGLDLGDCTILAADTAGLLLPSDASDPASSWPGDLATALDRAREHRAVLIAAVGTSEALTDLATRVAERWPVLAPAAPPPAGEERLNRPTGAAWRERRPDRRPTESPRQPTLVFCLLGDAGELPPLVPDLPGIWTQQLDAAIAAVIAPAP